MWSLFNPRVGRCLVVLLALLAFSIPKSKAAEADPASAFTNLFYLRRQMQFGGRLAWQERVWILNDSFRDLRDEFVLPQSPPPTLDMISEPVWEDGERSAEMIRTKASTQMRFRGIAGWIDGNSSQVLTDEVFQAARGVVTNATANSLTNVFGNAASYFPQVDLQKIKSYPGAVWERDRVICKALSQPGITNLVWALDFDPVTQLKRRERLWFKGQLILEKRWQTNAPIDPTQFQVSDRDQDKWRKPPPAYPAAVMPKPARGIGIVLPRPGEFGPFAIKSVLLDSPSGKAGVQGGSLIVSINGQSTSGMPLNLFLAACQEDDVDTPVTIEVESPKTRDRMQYSLRRQELKPGPVNSDKLPAR